MFSGDRVGRRRSGRASVTRLILGRLGLAIIAVTAIAASAGAKPGDTPVTEFSGTLPPGAVSDSIVTAPGGNLWFVDTGNNEIGEITPAGAVTEYAQANGLQAGSAPKQITPGPGGNLWFTDDGTTPAIGTITPSGTITEYSTGLNAGSVPVAISEGADGNLWFTDDGTTPAIGTITPSGTITEYSTGLNAGSVPNDIVSGPDGNLWFTDDGTTPAIGTITPSGTITEYSTPVTSGMTGLNSGSSPQSITSGPNGDLWFTDDGTKKTIGYVTTTGTITELPVTALPTGAVPLGIVTGSDGNLWYADSATGSIGRVTVGGTVTEFPTGITPKSKPTAITSGPDQNLWFTDNGPPAIGRLAIVPVAQITSPANGQVIPVGTFTATSFSCSAGEDVIQSCEDSSGAVSPGSLATNQIGTFSYTVTAQTVYGTTSSTTVNYTVSGTAPVNITPPSLSGTATAGSQLSCGQGTWTELPTGYTTTWLRNGTPIIGAEDATYTVQKLDEGNTITCSVVAENGAGSSSPAVSPSIAVPVPSVKQCPAASGSLSGARLGLGQLGLTRSQTRHVFADSSRQASADEDTFCLTPAGITAGYGTTALLGHLARRQRQRYLGRVVWLSTKSPYYSVRQIRVGATPQSAIRTLKLRDPVRVGSDDWWFLAMGANTLVVRTDNRGVSELALTPTALATGNTDRRRLITRFS